MQRAVITEVYYVIQKLKRLHYIFMQLSIILYCSNVLCVCVHVFEKARVHIQYSCVSVNACDVPPVGLLYSTVLLFISLPPTSKPRSGPAWQRRHSR